MLLSRFLSVLWEIVHVKVSKVLQISDSIKVIEVLGYACASLGGREENGVRREDQQKKSSG